MHKNTKRLIGAILAVAVLGVAYAVLLHTPEASSDTEQTTITDIANGALSGIQLSLRNGEQYTVQIKTDTSGTAYTMVGGEADANYSSQLMEQLNDAASTLSGRVIEQQPTDLAKYGLSDTDETDTIVIIDTDGNSTTLRIGKTNEGFGTYCTVNADNTVLLIDTETAETLTHPQSYYRNLTLLGGYYSLSGELETLSISQMSDGTSFALSRRDTSAMPEDIRNAYSDFLITEPISCDADDNALANGLLSELQSAITAKKIVTDTPENLSEYGLEDTAVRIHLTANNLDETLLIGSDTEAGRYVKTASSDTIYLCDSSAFDFLNSDWEEWRSTAVFHCALTELKSVMLTYDAVEQHIVFSHLSAEENEAADTAESFAELADGTELDASKLHQALTTVHFVRTIEAPTPETNVQYRVSITLTDDTTHTLAFTKGGSREYLVSVDGAGYAYGIAQADLTAILDAAQPTT